MLTKSLHIINVVVGLKSYDGEIEASKSQKAFYYAYYGVTITVVCLLGRVALGY